MPKSKRKMTPRLRNKWVIRRKSRVHGSGLFALADIPKGHGFVEYAGPRISRKEGQKRMEEGNAFIMTVDRKREIDGSVRWNLARYANHSCHPNAESIQCGYRIWLTSMRKISKGEEITYDYCYSIADHKENPCRCGHPKCFGFIVHTKHRKHIRN